MNSDEKAKNRRSHLPTQIVVELGCSFTWDTVLVSQASVLKEAGNIGIVSTLK